VRPLRRIRVLAVEIGRSDEELEALRVRLGAADALVHVVAADPLRARSDTDLVPGSVVADRGPGRVRPMTVVVTRGHRAEPARIRAVAVDVRVDRVVPVEVVVGARPVPATVVRLERIVRPAHARVLVGDDDPRARNAQAPEVGRMHERDVRLDRVRARRGQKIERGPELVAVGRREPVRRVVRLDRLDVGPCGQAVHEHASPRADHELVRDPERAVRDALSVEHRLERPLRLLGRPLQRPVDVPASGVLILHRVRLAEVGLLSELDDERALPARSRVAQDAVLNFSCVTGQSHMGPLASAREDWCYRHDQPGEREHDRDLDSCAHSDSPPWVPRCPAG
jgi:hypothetical protein